MRAIRIFIAEGEGAKGKASGAQGPAAAGEEKKGSVVYRRFLPLTNPGIGYLNFLVPDLAGRGLVWFCVEL
jgi:hypothetical protein